MTPTSATSTLIKPQTLKGFRDYLPETMMAREGLMETIRRVFRSYGYAPIDTPALEYSEILLGKGSEETDKQLFRFVDQGGRDVALRFDLTVPLARFVAQHAGQIAYPFRAYHIAPVWRAESPQRGRFREFFQADADIIGSTSNVADIEIAILIHELFHALGFERFTIRVNSRQVLNGLLEKRGLTEKQAPILRALDKLAKQKVDVVQAEMVAKAGISAAQAEGLLTRIRGLSKLSDPEEVLAQLDSELSGNAVGTEGTARLAELYRTCAAAGVPQLKIDISIARGLDYYTGTVYETTLDELPDVGSVCSGGRYDNLAGLYTRQELPGVGASLGLDRLLAAMEELGLLPKGATPAPVVIVYFAAGRLRDYLRVAAALRQRGIGCELYPEPRPLDKQLKFADRKGFRVAVIAGEDEFARGVWQVKDLAHRSSAEVSEPELPEKVLELLSRR